MAVLEILILLGLILANGFLAMAELAVVSARRPRIGVLGTERQRRAWRRLADEPGRFLSTVQIGITLVGVLAGAFGGATLAERAGSLLETGAGLDPDLAGPLGFGIIVTAITYLSLIIGELVPKRLALARPEPIALLVAPIMGAMARAAAPLVTLLDGSARLLFALLGPRGADAPRVTEEEIRHLIAEAETEGLVEPEETQMIARVMRLGDLPVRAMMTPRTEVDWLDLDAPAETLLAQIRASAHSSFPAGHGSLETANSIIAVKDLLDASLEGRPFDPRLLARPAPILHDTLDALEAINVLKAAGGHLALVVDEYGSLQGVVTLADILGSIAASPRGGAGGGASTAVRRADGSWLIDGTMPADELAELLGLALPARRDYHTAAGFVLAELARLPATGDRFIAKGYRFEVLDMDGKRVDKILAARTNQRHLA